MSRRTRGVVACAAVVLLATGCSHGPPEIDAPDLSAADAATCRDFVNALPETLGGHEPAATTGDTVYGAAWGDPAIVLTCGVGPVDLTEVPPCTVVNGVGWVVQETDGRTTLTADGYRPRVRLVVPDDYEQPAGLVTGLAPLVKKYLRLEERCL
ncbi:DUF3515 domain-containing protein [Nocardioides aquiterrae]|uniref:DUF3515 domain-containing protein n=1 Tax=Nocardioides aquiterrae TaxID=203799 RepID=A0ABN1UQN9_9ACTN